MSDMDIPQNIGQLVKLLNLGSLKERTRRKFDKAFKLMVVKLHKRDKSSDEIARGLDMATDLVRR